MVLTENHWKDDRYSMRLDISWRTSSLKRGQKKEETKRSGSPSLGFSSEQGGQENLIARDSRFEVAPPMFSAISTRYHYGIATLSAISSLRIRSPGQPVTLSNLFPFELTHYLGIFSTFPRYLLDRLISQKKKNWNFFSLNNCYSTIFFIILPWKEELLIQFDKKK